MNKLNEQNLNTYEAQQADTGKVFSCFTKGDSGAMPSSPGENYHHHDKSDDDKSDDDKSLQSDSCFDSDTDCSDSDSEQSDTDDMEICDPPLGYEDKDIYKDHEESIIYGSTRGTRVYESLTDRYKVIGFFIEGKFVSTDEMERIIQLENEERTRALDSARSSSLEEIPLAEKHHGATITKIGVRAFWESDFIKMKIDGKKRLSSGDNSVVNLVYDYSRRRSEETKQEKMCIGGIPAKDVAVLIYKSVLFERISDMTDSLGINVPDCFPIDRDYRSKTEKQKHDFNLILTKFFDRLRGKKKVTQQVSIAIKKLLPIPQPENNKKAIAKFNKDNSSRTKDLEKNIDIVKKWLGDEEVSRQTNILNKLSNGMDAEVEDWLNSLTSESPHISSGDMTIINNYIARVDKNFNEIDYIRFDNEPDAQVVKAPVQTKVRSKRDAFLKDCYLTKEQSVSNNIKAKPIVQERRYLSLTKNGFTQNMSSLAMNKYTLSYLMSKWIKSKTDFFEMNEYQNLYYYEIFALANKLMAQTDGNEDEVITQVLSILYKKIGFSNDDAIKKICFDFPYIIQKPYLCREKEGTILTDIQVEFINRLREHILSPESNGILKRLLAWNQSFGGGKTTCTVGVCDSLYNESDVATVIVLPSKETILSFSKLCKNPYYIVRWDDDENFPTLIAPHNKTAPMYKCGKRDKVIKLADHFAYKDMTLAEKLHIITSFNPNKINASELAIKQGKFVIPMTNIRGEDIEPFKYSEWNHDKPVPFDITWHSNKKKFAPPKIFFMDYASAVHAKVNQQHIEGVLGRPLKFIIDECVAAIDAKVGQAQNPMFQTLADLFTDPMDMVILSASLNEEQLRSNKYFENHEITMSRTENDTNSLVQLVVEGLPVNPFNSLDVVNFNKSIEKWNTNCTRCFPPKMLHSILKRFPNDFHKVGFDYLKPHDIRNMKSYLNYVSEMIQAVKEFSDESKQAVIDFTPTYSCDKPSSEDKELILTSGLIHEVVYEKLGDSMVTIDRINSEIEVEKSIKINELAEEKKIYSTSKSKNIDTSGMSLQEKSRYSHEEVQLLKDNIGYLESTIKNEDFDITLTTNLGKVVLSSEWRKTWSQRLSPFQLAVAASGVGSLEYEDEDIYQASRISYPNGVGSAPAKIIHTSKKVVCDIEHCFGLNDKEIKYVSINDPAQVMGIDTVLQGIARACRSKNENPIGTADISRASLKLFNHLGSTSLDTLHATEDMQIVVKRKELWCDIQKKKEEKEKAERDERIKKAKLDKERTERFNAIMKAEEAKWNKVPGNSMTSSEEASDPKPVPVCLTEEELREQFRQNLISNFYTDPSEFDRKRGACRFHFQNGSCAKGRDCDFHHSQTLFDQFGWQRPSNGDQRSDAGDQRPSGGGQRSAGGGQRAAGGGQRANGSCHTFINYGNCNRQGCRFDHTGVAPFGNTTGDVCVHYLRGNCRNGVNCKKYHPVKK